MVVLSTRLPLRALYLALGVWRWYRGIGVEHTYFAFSGVERRSRASCEAPSLMNATLRTSVHSIGPYDKPSDLYSDLLMVMAQLFVRACISAILSLRWDVARPTCRKRLLAQPFCCAWRLGGLSL